ncbi:MAG: hypothetical protein IJS13_07655 [Paludibacteraceae bacterium]|nr:hypothetical protein [Paludibacteraceae bacterium]
MKKLILFLAAAVVCFSAGAQITCGTINAGTTTVTFAEKSLKKKTLPGVFSVAFARQVRFSSGNLQYLPSSGTFIFAENQYDCLVNSAGNINRESTRPTQTEWIDLFAWGCSGYNNRYPWWRNNLNFSTNYVSLNWGDRMTGTKANYDWGVYNAILNGGNVAGQWRTLTQEEWCYLLSGRTNAHKLRGKAYVNGVLCVILLPDGYDFSTGPYTESAWKTNFINKYNQTISLANWTTLETKGAVALPAGGIIVQDGSIYCEDNNPSYGIGAYWSADLPYCFMIQLSNFSDYDYEIYWLDYKLPDYGCSVRLVQNLN